MPCGCPQHRHSAGGQLRRQSGGQRHGFSKRHDTLAALWRKFAKGVTRPPALRRGLQPSLPPHHRLEAHRRRRATAGLPQGPAISASFATSSVPFVHALADEIPIYARPDASAAVGLRRCRPIVNASRRARGHQRQEQSRRDALRCPRMTIYGKMAKYQFTCPRSRGLSGTIRTLPDNLTLSPTRKVATPAVAGTTASDQPS